MHKQLPVLGFCLVVIFGWTSVKRDPIGEQTNYDLDRDPARTSSLVKSGTMTNLVTKFVADSGDGSGAGYEVMTSYDLNVQLAGRQQGSKALVAPEAYFTPEFMQNLRRDKQYTSEKFKVKHEGFADARTLDGHTYLKCDSLLIYDIKDIDEGVMGVAHGLLLGAAGAQFEGTIDNMEIRTLISEGVPVLGAVKLDVSGDYNGMPVKAGADYIAP